MITNCGVTFWHYDEEREIYMRTQIASAWSTDSTRTESDGSDGGARQKHKCTIRVPTVFNMLSKISIGDYARIGIHDNEPMRGRDLKIVEIKDNRYGLNPHWRVNCE